MSPTDSQSDSQSESHSEDAFSDSLSDDFSDGAYQKAQEKKRALQKRFWFRARLFTFILALALIPVILLAFYFAPQVFIKIPAGHIGVLFRNLTNGTEIERVYPEGLNVILPWNTMVAYDARVSAVDATVDILNADGLTVNVDVNIRYRVKRDKVALLHKDIGPDFVDKVIVPWISSKIREIIGKYKADDLYRFKRDEIQEFINEEGLTPSIERYIELEHVNLLSIRLPAQINTAIEKKLEQEQEVAEYEFRIEKEKKEAARKKIEAEGIEVFQKKVSQSLNKGVLVWQGIRATSELSKSNNAKTIILGPTNSTPFSLLQENM